MEENKSTEKSLFYVTLSAGAFLVLVLSGILNSLNTPVTGVFVELFTIPSILLLIAAIVYNLYWVLLKGKKRSFYGYGSLILASGLIVSMFFVH